MTTGSVGRDRSRDNRVLLCSAHGISLTVLGLAIHLFLRPKRYGEGVLVV